MTLAKIAKLLTELIESEWGERDLNSDWKYDVALRELSRRAEIERRRDEWIRKMNRTGTGVCCIEHCIDVDEDGNERHSFDLITLVRGDSDAKSTKSVASGEDPDYHTALDAALTKAGA